MRIKNIAAAAGLLATAMVATPALATVTTGTLTGGTATTGPVNQRGEFRIINAPAAVGNDNFDNNNVRAFNERQSVRLSTALAVDAGGGNDNMIAAGTLVDSHYINFDPLNAETVTGTVTFESRVLGIIFTRANLNGSDFLGAAGTDYQRPNLRGFENADSATFAGRMVTFDLSASSPGDSFRVITAGAVPEPATWAMMLIGFGMVGFASRRRRKDATVTYA